MKEVVQFFLGLYIALLLTAYFMGVINIYLITLAIIGISIVSSAKKIDDTIKNYFKHLKEKKKESKELTKASNNKVQGKKCTIITGGNITINNQGKAS